MHRRALVATACLCLAGCGGRVRLIVETSRPARIVDWGGAEVCASTPCTHFVSRQTCGPFNSSSGYLILTALTADGAKANSSPLATCDIRDGDRVFIALPPAAAP